jgi:hypothetical protein
MVNSDLSTDLSLGILSPASSVRALDRRSPHSDPEGKARRRPRREEEETGDDDGANLDTADPLPHQLDHLA